MTASVLSSCRKRKRILRWTILWLHEISIASSIASGRKSANSSPLNQLIRIYPDRLEYIG